MVGRGTRLAEGKDHLLLLDFLWHTERHELCRPAHLIAENDEVAKKMIETTENNINVALDLEDLEEQAKEDVTAQREQALAEQLAQMRKRQRKLVDPLQFEMSIHGEDFNELCTVIWMGNESTKQEASGNIRKIRHLTRRNR